MKTTDFPTMNAAAARFSSTQVYTDLNSLQSLKATGDDSPEALEKVAQQFESLFISMMLSSMRDANAIFEQDSLFNSNETRMYRDMMDSQLSITLAEGGGIGLKDILMRQLSKTLPESSMAKAQQQLSSMAPNERAVINQLSSRVMKSMRAGDTTDRASSDVPVVSSNFNNANGAMDNEQRFDSPRDFIEIMMPIAEKVAEKLGIDPRFLVAQSALETGWGQKMIRGEDGSNSFNLFGIKADQRWQGDQASVITTEYRQGVAIREQANFRAYDSFEQSFEDYLDFLQHSDRYQQALNHRGDATRFFQGIQHAGYATDPNYADKVLSIADNDLFGDWD